MHKWTNDTTGPNHSISTGPTPQGELSDFRITVGFVKYPYEQHPKVWNAIRGNVLKNHIIPLILRVPEMRDTLRECAEWLEVLHRTYSGEWSSEASEVALLLDRIHELTAPTGPEAVAARKAGA
jgi:hypothetical protein